MPGRLGPWLAAAFVASLSGCARAPVEVPGPQGVTAAFAALPAEQRAFLDDLSRRTFRYFWETTSPDTCLAYDRWPARTTSSIAAVGFALTAYGIGAERKYVDRRDAAARTLQCLRYLYEAPQGPQERDVTGYRGFFYHFLHTKTGLRHRTTELSSVDSSLLFAGVLFAQSYFDRHNDLEQQIREQADRLYRRAEWPYFVRKPGDNRATNLEGSKGLAMGWEPEIGFGAHDWIGYNEGMLVYVLALGSPTHPVDKTAWDEGWAARLDQDWGEHYGQTYLTFEPMFGHQYSHVWIDFRGIQDEFMRMKETDYFENSRRAALAQYAYAQDNPNGWIGYGGAFWGLTACDGPGYFPDVTVNGEQRSFFGYSARGVSPFKVRDDGTVAPTAAGGSIPFAPDISIRALMAMKDEYGDLLYTDYGFKDAYNATFQLPEAESRLGSVTPSVGWIARDHLGIDQGPIVAMLENYRSDLVWKTMRKNPYIRRGLLRLGFRGGWLDQDGTPGSD